MRPREERRLTVHLQIKSTFRFYTSTGCLRAFFSTLPLSVFGNASMRSKTVRGGNVDQYVIELSLKLMASCLEFLSQLDVIEYLTVDGQRWEQLPGRIGRLEFNGGGRETIRPSVQA